MDSGEMMPDPKPPAIGEEVASSLVPEVGADVSSLMQSGTPQSEVKPGTNTALTLAAGSAVIPHVSSWALRLALNPDAWKTGKAIGEAAGGLSATAGALMSGNPAVMLSTPAIAAQGAWGGAKAGWRATNLLQRMAPSISSTLSRFPARGMSVLAAAQGVNDLAQMADPTRRDIGVLGVGSSVPDTEIQTRLTASKPSAIEIAQAKELIKNGMEPLKAISQVAKGDRVKYGQLVTAVR